MRYWWVNQNQTYRQEVEGGYLWSPKRSASGARNPFYESMREVSPGDLIFSFMDTRIQAIGIAQSYCWESPKPLEFGSAGQNWENIGWKVEVAFTSLSVKIRPKDHIDILRPLLPERYSPLQPIGNGLQSIYLTEIPADLAEVLMGLIGQEVEPLAIAPKAQSPSFPMTSILGRVGWSERWPTTPPFQKRIGRPSFGHARGRAFSRTA
jgi:putative restriction endonuclease